MRAHRSSWRAGRGVPVMLALLAWTGCARLRPAQSSGEAHPAKGDEAAAGTAAEPNHHGKLVLDPAQVLAVQMQAIDPQRVEYEDDTPWGVNRFTHWLDRTHEMLFIPMDTAVRRMDTLWLPAGTEYNYEVSTFRIRVLARAGGRGKEKDYDVKVRFSTKLALPGLQRKLYLFIDNIGRDDLPGEDPLKQESDTRVGVRSERSFIKGGKISVSGGLRLRSSGPVFYTDLEWRRAWELLGGELVAAPGVFYYSDEGFGQSGSLVYTRPVGPRQAFQLRLVERSTEATQGFEFEQTLRYAWYRSGRKRGWLAQASLFPHLKDFDFYGDNAMVNLTWRDALYKKWIFYTLTPQVDFAREDAYEPRPSLRIGLEILFGGKPADLL